MTMGRTEMLYALNEFLEDMEDMQHDDNDKSQIRKRSQSTADAFSDDQAMQGWLFSNIWNKEQDQN